MTLYITDHIFKNLYFTGNPFKATKLIDSASLSMCLKLKIEAEVLLNNPIKY